jgi:tyrosine-protein phosphatase YwqE
MWPFKSVDKIKDSGLFDGFTDWHSHILPGVDDGIRTMDESLAALKAYEEVGIKKVWLTPHIMEDCPNSTERLRARFEDLKNEYNGPIELRLASENMLDSLFEERLITNDFLPIGEEGNHILIETSYVNPHYGMEDMIEGVMAKGYTPILAHPERYRYMNEDDYYKWKERGLLFQCNYVSILGGYGETARRKAEWLLKEGFINFTGSDLHRKAIFDHVLEQKPKSSDALKRLIEVAKNQPIR